MAAPAQFAQEEKRKPGWMSIAGGPKEPNRNDFRAKLTAAAAEKSKLFDRLKAIRDEFDTSDGGEREGIDRERKELRARMNDIEKARNELREKRKAKDQQMDKIRKTRAEVENAFKDLQSELGAFKEESDVDNAIERIMTRMETGNGSLRSEKAVIKRLSQLEGAKSLILQLQPLQDQINDSHEKELELQHEYRDIFDRIGSLNKEFEQSVNEKTAKDLLLKKTQVDRSHLFKEREEIRAKLTVINGEIDAARKTFDTAMEAWNKWRDEAQAKYRAQIDAERKEREARWAAKEAARKAELRQAKAQRRLNPFANQIEAVTTLVRYLEDKVKAIQRDQEERERLKKLAAFDPKSLAPAGMATRQEEDDWLFADRTKVQKVKPAKPAAAAAQAKDAEAAAAKASKAADKNKYIQHPKDKCAAFDLVKVDVPLTVAQVPATIAALKEKKKAWEKEIKDSVDNVSDEEEEEDAEEGEAAPAAATNGDNKAEATEEKAEAKEAVATADE